MAPVRSIGAASRGYENSGHQHGRKCEQLAAAYYSSQGYQIIKRRWKLPLAEIDLLCRHPKGHLVVVEVKSQSPLGYKRLKPSQTQRLKRAVLYLCARYEIGVELHLAIVSQEGDVQVVTDIFG